MADTNGGGVEIKILTMDSQTRTVRVDKSVPVPTLKEQIADVTGVFPGHQRLIFRGKVLKDDQNLCAYHIEDGHTLHLVVKPSVDPSPESARDTPTYPATIISSNVSGQADGDLRALINRRSDQISMEREFVDEEQGISDSSPESARDPPTQPVVHTIGGSDLRAPIYRLSDQESMGRQFVDQESMGRQLVDEEQGTRDSFNSVSVELADNSDILRSIGEEGAGNTDAQRALARVLALQDERGILSQRVSDCLFQLTQLVTSHAHVLYHLQAAIHELARATITVQMGQAPAAGPTTAVVQAPAAVSEERLLSESMDPASQASGDQESASSRPRREGDGPEAKRQRRG